MVIINSIKIKIKYGVPYIVRNNINNLTNCMKFSISIFFLLLFYFSDDWKFDTFDQHSKQLVNFNNESVEVEFRISNGG